MESRVNSGMLHASGIDRVPVLLPELLIAALVLGGAIWCSGGMLSAQSDSAPREQAILFLQSRQGPTGVWGAESSTRTADTLAAIRALESDGGATAGLSALRARGALALSLPETPATVSEAALELLLIEDPSPSLLNEMMNTDGGWGTRKSHDSSIPDTLTAVEALLETGNRPVQGWPATVSYLRDSRKEDGFWYLSDEPSQAKLALTARVLLVLLDIQQRTDDLEGLAKMIASGSNLLRQCKRDNGSFCVDSDPTATAPITSSAWAYRFLVRTEQPGLHCDTLAFLALQQAEDGSWSKANTSETSVYITAEVLRAMTAVKIPDSPPRADLAVSRSTISFAPLNPGTDDTVRLNAYIFNLGTAASEHVEAAFYDGDPRLGGEQIGNTQMIPKLPIKGSALVTESVEASSFTSSPRIFVRVDPDRRVPERILNNNTAWRFMLIEGLAEEPIPDLGDLYTGPGYISFNGRSGGTLHLVESRTVGITAVIANIGGQTVAPSIVRVTDNGAVAAEMSIPAIPGGELLQTTVPWNPEPGNHTIRVTLDATGTVPENDETNNTFETELEVIGAECTVTVSKLTGGTEIPGTSFNAYEIAGFTVTAAYENAVVDLAVTGPGGELADMQPVPLAEAGRYQWNTTNSAPGEYRITAIFRSGETGQILETVSEQFDILPTAGLRDLRLSIPLRVSQSDEIDSFKVSVALQNGANRDAEWDLSWELLDPAGRNTAASATPQSIPLLGTQLSKAIKLNEPLSGTVYDSGRYIVRVTAENQSGDTEFATAEFYGMPDLHVNIEKSVVPSEILPNDGIRARTLLRLSVPGETTAPEIPVAIRRIEKSAQAEIPDSSSEHVTVTGIDVINVINEIVPDGTKVAAYVPYGTLEGGEDAPGTPANPKVRILTTQNGNVQTTYHPSGDGLRDGDHSLTVVQFYQFFPDRERWLGEHIAHTEIFLRGESTAD